MSANANWPRWIKSSIFKHLQVNLPGTIKKFMEAEERTTNQASTWFELRMDGPSSEELSQGYWRLKVDVNVLCVCPVGTDLYQVDRMIGAVVNALGLPIGVFQLGDGPGDDPSASLGCLFLINERGENIVAHQFGQIEAKIKQVQGTVEAKFFIDLQE